MGKEKSLDEKVHVELFNKLQECKINNFMLDTDKKILAISYREDFDVFYKQFKAEPRVQTPSEYSPYGVNHFAYFYYKDGWEIRGSIIHHKPK